MDKLELDKSIYQLRNQMNGLVHQLAEMAIEDSSTYNEAINKIKSYKWHIHGKTGLALIESAIEVVEKKALNSEV